jgi:hypothetical protein
VTQQAVVSSAASSTQTFAIASTSGRRTLRFGTFAGQTDQTNPLDRLNHLDRLDDLATV